MRKILLLSGALVLAGAITSPVLAQITSPGPIKVTDATSPDLYPYWGTTPLLAEYYCTAAFTTNFVAPSGVTFVPNTDRVSNSANDYRSGSVPTLANDTYGLGTMMAGLVYLGS
jgi:hypothetical protein